MRPFLAHWLPKLAVAALAIATPIALARLAIKYVDAHAYEFAVLIVGGWMTNPF